MDGMLICKHSADAVANTNAVIDVLADADRKINFFSTTFLLSDNNNTIKFQLHLQFFACHVVQGCC